MAHYSSQSIYYEDGAKNPLKSIPVKLLVLASFAQIGVSAGNEDSWASIMAYVNDPPSVETYYRVLPIREY